MRNNKKLMAVDGIFNTWFKGFVNIFTFATAAFLITAHFPTAAIAEKKEQAHSVNLQRLLTFKIAGISLQTPPDSILSILESQGYTQTGIATYTKQIQVPGQRKSIYRIEVDDGPDQRQIIYFRGQSGGRVKSSALQEKPIQADEIDMANELYQLVCTQATPQVLETRACQPATNMLIIFGDGQFIDIGEKISAQLNISADSTTIGIKHIKK